MTRRFISKCCGGKQKHTELTYGLRWAHYFYNNVTRCCRSSQMSYTPDTGYFLHSRYHNLSGMETDLKCDFGNQKSAAQTDNLDNPTSASSSNKNTSDNNKMKTKTKEKTAKDAPVKKSAQASSNAPGDPVTAQQAAPGFSDVEIHAASGDNDILSADNQDNGEGTPLMPPTDDLTNKKYQQRFSKFLRCLGGKSQTIEDLDSSDVQQTAL